MGKERGSGTPRVRDVPLAAMVVEVLGAVHQLLLCLQERTDAVSGDWAPSRPCGHTPGPISSGSRCLEGKASRRAQQPAHGRRGSAAAPPVGEGVGGLLIKCRHPCARGRFALVAGGGSGGQAQLETLPASPHGPHLPSSLALGSVAGHTGPGPSLGEAGRGSPGGHISQGLGAKTRARWTHPGTSSWLSPQQASLLSRKMYVQFHRPYVHEAGVSDVWPKHHPHRKPSRSPRAHPVRPRGKAVISAGDPRGRLLTKDSSFPVLMAMADSRAPVVEKVQQLPQPP